jgi:hypothetical protein
MWLLFTTSNPGAWTAFDTGEISGGELVFGGNTGMLLGATGVVTRDPSGLPILAPPIIDPPSIDPPDPIVSASVPEASTWAMLLLGFAGLGLAAKGRRAIGFLAGRA